MWVREEGFMKRRTYNNMLKATRLIMAKGYDKETANELAMRCFDNAEMSKNGMPIEWWIEKIQPADTPDLPESRQT